jgi:putative transcriptional regulator
MKNKIKQFRQKINLTQEELAERAGVRRETIVFLEQGKYNPSLRLAMSIARELKTTIEELFFL